MAALHKLMPDGRVKVLSEDGSISYIDQNGGVTKENEGSYFGDVLKNTPQSALNVLNSVAHPMDSIRPLGQAIVGGFQKAFPGKTPESTQYVDTFDTTVENAKQRYGHPVDTFRKDPVGFGLEVYGAADGLLGAGRSLAGAGALGGEMRTPFRSPAVAEEGLSTAMSNLGDPGLTAEAAGKSLLEPYRNRVATPFAAESAAPPTPPVKQVPKPGEMFGPVYKQGAADLHPADVSSSEVGKLLQERNKAKISKLRGIENEKWSSVTSGHGDHPAPMDNAKTFVESMLQDQGQSSALDRLNPNLRESAMKSPNPEATARALLEYGQSSKTPMNFMDPSAPEPSAPDARAGHVQGGYDVFNKMLKMSEGSPTFEAIKTLRSEIGQKVKDWGGRGDQFAHNLKEAYRALTKDMEAAAETGGFKDKMHGAFQSTKDFFNYVDQPSSKIIGKAKYPSDILNKVIKAGSPERVDELFTQHDLTPQDKSAVGRAVLDKLYQDAHGDPKQFALKYDKMGADTRAKLFGENAPVADAIRKSVTAIDDAIAKAKIKTPDGVLGTRPILSRTGAELDRIMTKAAPSEIVPKLMANGTPEMARVAIGAIGPEAAPILRRAMINEVLKPSAIPGPKGSTIDIGAASQRLWKMDPEFIKEVFGDDASTVNAIRDGYKYLAENQKGPGQLIPARFYNVKAHMVNLGNKLVSKYRLTNQIEDTLIRSAGPEVAAKIIKPSTIRSPFSK